MNTNTRRKPPMSTHQRKPPPPPPPPPNPRLSYNEFEDLEPSEESDVDVHYFTPNTSPRTSIASSLLMFPTGRKPSRKSLRLSDASDSAAPQTPTSTTPITSTRTPSTTTPRHQNQRAIHTLSTSSSLSSTSLEPHSIISDYTGSVETTTHVTSPQLAKKAKKGITKHTRHGTVTITPVLPSTTHSVKTTTPSERKNTQLGLTDADSTKTPPTTSSVSAPSAVAVKATVTAITTPHGLVSRKHPKSPASAVPEKNKQDVVQETEAPKTKEKEKELDSSSSKLRMKDKGKEKAKTPYGSDTVMGGTSPRGPPIPHTFSAFAPLPIPTSSPSAPPTAKTNGTNYKLPLPPPPLHFPPPPSHSPQLQPQQPKNSLNGSAAAYTYAHRQKASTTPKPVSGGSNSIMMNMAALLEEDELDVEDDGRTPTRRLRRTTAGNGQGRDIKGKERRSFDSISSGSDSSHSQFGSPPRLNATLNSNTTASQPQSYSDPTTFRNPSKTMSSEVNAMSVSFPGELPSKGTQGYSSLVLPRAPPPVGSHLTGTRSPSISGQRKWFGAVGGKEGKVDLTRGGVAQTTMASVEVVRGLGRQQGQNGLGGRLLGIFGRKRSISGGSAGPKPIEGLSKAVDDASEDLSSKGKAPPPPPPPPPIAPAVEGTILGFTSYRRPPGFVPSNSVLVQVWAVGVDGVDGRLVGVRFGEHIWRERRVVGDSGGRGEEGGGGAETDWEREEREAGGDDVDISQSTPQQNRGLAGLSRSFSLRMSRPKQRATSGANAAAQQQQQQDHPSQQQTPSSNQQKPTRSFSLRRNKTVQPSPSQQENKTPFQKQARNQQQRIPHSTSRHRAEVGYIPGRSFVGRVLECGWDVRDEVVRKGEWVVGLLDVKRCGALTEYIVVDRHRIHRVPHPRKVPQRGNGHSNMTADADASMHFQDDNSNMSALTLEELALLPLCGIPAYRAVRTFIYAFSSLRDGGMAAPTINERKGIEFVSSSSKVTTEHPQDRRRRVLVLRGHDGVGAMAVQMLAQRGWRVSVHVPFSSSPAAEHDFPRNIQDRARDWGADEIIFDEESEDGIDDGRIAAIRVIESLREDGDMFDAVLDTVGGKEVREAGERLLRSAGVSPVIVGGGFIGNEPVSPRVPSKAKGVAQFTTLVGDAPERPIPTAGDNFRAGIRSLRFGSSDGGGGAGSAGNSVGGTGNGDEADMKGNKVGYAWVSVAQDVDWEGEDIGDTLRSVLRLALSDGVRPVIGRDADNLGVVPFERAPSVFVDRGPLSHGGNVVVKIAG